MARVTRPPRFRETVDPPHTVSYPSLQEGRHREQQATVAQRHVGSLSTCPHLDSWFQVNTSPQLAREAEPRDSSGRNPYRRRRKLHLNPHALPWAAKFP